MIRTTIALALAGALAGCVPAISMGVGHSGPVLPQANREQFGGTEAERPANCPTYTPLRDCIAPPAPVTPL